MNETTTKEDRLRELLESAIADFRKLKPWLGAAADATADMYQEHLDSLK